MEIVNLNQNQAQAYHGLHKDQIYYIHRRLTNGEYRLVGAVKWNCNYFELPIKEKYRALIYFSDRR